jgi:hypothetical protein
MSSWWERIIPTIRMSDSRPEGEEEEQGKEVEVQGQQQVQALQAGERE